MEACRIFTDSPLQATNSSNPYVRTIYSYSKRCRSSGAPLVRVLDPKAEPPCRVISGRKRTLSAPLSKFTYDYRERAFSNREGYTWTPMYLQHCSSLDLVSKTRVNDKNYSKESIESRSDANRKWDSGHSKPFLPPFSSDKNEYCSWINPPDQDRDVLRIKQQTSYSKFMESPYIKIKDCCLKPKKITCQIAPEKITSCQIAPEFESSKKKFHVFSDRSKSRCIIPKT